MKKTFILVIAIALFLAGCTTTNGFAPLVTVEEYNADGKIISRRDKTQKGFKKWEYNDSGKVTHCKDTVHGIETWIEYGDDGKMKYQKYVTGNGSKDGSVEETWYDLYENTIRKIINGKEFKTVLEYDSKGNIVKKIENGEEILYEYDENGRETRQTCATHDYFTEYDSHGNKIYIKQVYPTFDKVEEYCIDYEYDGSGNVTYKYDPKMGEEFFGEYNPQGKLIYAKRIYFGTLKSVYGEEQEIWYEYDENGNILHSRNSSGSEFWYEYDQKGNQTHEKDSAGHETWYENSYYKDGTLKTVKTYSKDF